MDNKFIEIKNNEDNKPRRSERTLRFMQERKKWEDTKFIPELEPYCDNGMLTIVRPDIYKNSDLKTKSLTEEEKKIIGELEKKAEEAKTRMTPFVEKGFREGTLVMKSDHIHLKYNDEKYWGHYTSPTKNGVRVTVYFKENIKGDPMDIEGSRGPSINLEIPLDLELRKKILGQMNKTLEEGLLDSFPDSKARMLEEVDEVVSGLN